MGVLEDIKSQTLVHLQRNEPKEEQKPKENKSFKPQKI